MGLDNDKLKLYHGNCCQHLCNILVEAGANHLSFKLSHLLCEDLAIIPSNHPVTCKIGDILCACDKEFNFTAKMQHDGMFYAWMEIFHPGSLFVPVVGVLNGNQQDASLEGVFPLYIGCSRTVAFLNERLCAGKTLLLLQFMCVLQICISSHHHCLKEYLKILCSVTYS